jgi:probable selenium-dependent hydroxylase accessory protein YqeC
VFSDRFGFRLPARVNFVGGGGKTSLILRLAEEQSAWLRVIYTTTTRIHPPPVAPERALLVCDHAGLLYQMLERIARDCSSTIHTIVVATRHHSPGLLSGVAPGFALPLDPSLFPLILNEADGARSVSLKIPRDGEPVLLQEADTLVPVVGLDALGATLGPESVFRWAQGHARLGLRAGEKITPETAAAVLLHPEGVCKGWTAPVEIVPFINKVDSAEDEAAARQLAEALLAHRSRLPIRRVVWGSVERGRVGSLE